MQRSTSSSVRVDLPLPGFIRLIPRRVRQHLLEFRYRGPCSPTCPQMMDQKCLVVLTIKTATPRMRSALAHGAIEPSAEDMTRATPPPDRLHDTDLKQPWQSLTETLRNPLVALEVVEHEKVARVKAGKGILSNPFNKTQECRAGHFPSECQPNLMRRGPSKVRQRLALTLSASAKRRLRGFCSSKTFSAITPGGKPPGLVTSSRRANCFTNTDPFMR